MMQSEPLAASVFEGRLHPLTIAFGLLKAARGIIYLVPLLLVGNKIWIFIALMSVIASTIVTSLGRYFSFTFRIEGNELIMQKCILERQQSCFTLDRIAEVSVEM